MYSTQVAHARLVCLPRVFGAFQLEKEGVADFTAAEKKQILEDASHLADYVPILPTCTLPLKYMVQTDVNQSIN